MAHPDQRDMAATEKRLLLWLEQKLPEGSDFRIRGLAMPGITGFSSDTLLAGLDWNENGSAHSENVVLRLKPKGFCVFPTYDLSLQYRCMRALFHTDVPVPEILWTEDDPEPLGAPFFVMQCIDGWVPSDNPPMHSAGKLFEMAPAEREAVWWSGIETLARLHRLDWKETGFEFLNLPQRGPTPLDQQLDYYEEYFDWGLASRERYPIIQAALDYLHRNQPKGDPVGICWGDSRLSNMLFQGTQCVAVLDWEMAWLGNPIQDLAWWNMSDLCFTQGLDIGRMEGFPTHEETALRWSELTGRSLEWLRYYEILVLLRFAVIMGRIGMQMKHYELLPPDASFDSDNLASVTLAKRLVIAGL